LSIICCANKRGDAPPCFTVVQHVIHDRFQAADGRDARAEDVQGVMHEPIKVFERRESIDQRGMESGTQLRRYAHANPHPSW